MDKIPLAATLGPKCQSIFFLFASTITLNACNPKEKSKPNAAPHEPSAKAASKVASHSQREKKLRKQLVQAMHDPSKLASMMNKDDGLHYYSELTSHTAFTMCTEAEIGSMQIYMMDSTDDYAEDDAGLYTIRPADSFRCTEDFAVCTSMGKKRGATFVFRERKGKKGLSLVIGVPKPGKFYSGSISDPQAFVLRNRHRCKMERILQGRAKSTELRIVRVAKPGAKLRITDYVGSKAQKEVTRMLSRFKVAPVRVFKIGKRTSAQDTMATRKKIVDNLWSPMHWWCEELTCQTSYDDQLLEITLRGEKSSDIAMLSLAPAAFDDTSERQGEIHRARQAWLRQLQNATAPRGDVSP